MPHSSKQINYLSKPKIRSLILSQMKALQSQHDLSKDKHGLDSASYIRYADEVFFPSTCLKVCRVNILPFSEGGDEGIGG